MADFGLHRKIWVSHGLHVIYTWFTPRENEMGASSDLIDASGWTQCS